MKGNYKRHIANQTLSFLNLKPHPLHFNSISNPGKHLYKAYYNIIEILYT